MKVIIAGSRGITSYEDVCQAVIDSGFEITEIVSGTARGADTLGELLAIRCNIPIKRMPAAWHKYGKQAGMIRNLDMASYADALIVVWDGCSKGTENMIRTASEMGLKVHIHDIIPF